ncbi:MAG: helix-turn-helix transcriptional regulator [Conexivisphaerales archaeon]
MAYERLYSKLTKENLWLYLLRTLIERPDYALSLKRRVESRFGFKTAAITFYFVLYRLESDKMVISSKVSGKRVYSCTEKGREELGKALGLIEELGKRLKF